MVLFICGVQVYDGKGLHGTGAAVLFVHQRRHSGSVGTLCAVLDLCVVDMYERSFVRAA